MLWCFLLLSLHVDPQRLVMGDCTFPVERNGLVLHLDCLFLIRDGSDELLQFSCQEFFTLLAMFAGLINCQELVSVSLLAKFRI